MNKGFVGALALIACAVQPARSATAQAPTAMPRTGPPQAVLCFRGHPQARCESFLLIESGLSAGIPHGSRRPPAHLAWELGWMRNTTPVDAYGGTVVGLFDEDERLLLGGSFRYRRWLTDRWSLDAAPGIVMQATDRDFGAIGPSLLVHAGAGAGDWARIVAELEILNRPDGQHAGGPISLLLGVRAGSYPALLVGPFLGWVAHFVPQLD